MKITLFLMTEKGYEVLKNLCLNGFSEFISCVVSSKDLTVLEDFYPSIQNLCIEYDICFYDRKDKYEIVSEYCLAISWRWLIQAENTRLIVIHDSLLPKYRGFAPLVNMLINEEKYIGITALYANSEFDRGDIIMQRKIEVSYPVKIKSAIEVIAKLYVEVANEIVESLVQNKPLSSYKQDESEASYSLWRDEDDYAIDWNQPSGSIKRFIDSVGFPYKGSFSIVDGEKIRIFNAEIAPDVRIENRVPGKVLFFENDNPIVVCGEGMLLLTEMKSDESEDKYQLKKYRTKFN